MRLSLLKLGFFVSLFVVFVAVPSRAIQPVYKHQPQPEVSKLAKVRSVFVKLSTGDVRAVLPHKNAQRPSMTLKGVDPRFVIVDTWSGIQAVAVLDDGTRIKPNYLSRGAMLGLKIGGGILAGIASVLGAIGGIVD